MCKASAAETAVPGPATSASSVSLVRNTVSWALLRPKKSESTF